MSLELNQRAAEYSLSITRMAHRTSPKLETNYTEELGRYLFYGSDRVEDRIG